MASDKVKTAALILAVKMWKDGSLDVKVPTDYEYGKCLSYLEKLDPCDDFENEDVKSYLKILLLNNIGSHFDRVATHRRWVNEIYELLLMADVPDLNTDLDERIESHDLSKYGPREALGFAIMSDKTDEYSEAGFRLMGFNLFKNKQVIGGCNECKKWQEDALKHYFLENRHQPEYHSYYFNKVSKTTLDKMSTIDLQENIIHMMAKKLEGWKLYEDRREDCHIYLIGDLSFDKHTKDNKASIKAILDGWLKCLHDFVTDRDNMIQKEPLKSWCKKNKLDLTCRRCFFFDEQNMFFPHY